MDKPIIYLAFANDQDAYLPMINRERKNIYRSLRRHHDEGLIRVEKEATSSLEDIFEVFNTYPDQVAIFHYGGHAGGTHLRLEQPDSGPQKAFARGLAQLLGQQENLQLVFLNGCATQGQVTLLHQQGVRAVIATSVSIQDLMATEFAEQFYNALSSHASLERAFRIASSFIASKYDEFDPIPIYRDAVFPNIEVPSTTLPWGLYVQPGGEDALKWSFPKSVSKKQVLRNRFDYESRMDVNDILIDIICEDLAQHNKDLDYELGKEELDIPSIKREIVDSFPTPIGEQLRKLFTRSNDPGQPDDMELFTLARLQQLSVTHRTTMQFICYILLSQLWDEKHKNPSLEISDEYIVDFNSFFALSKNNFQSFNFVKLINTITDFFDDHQIKYFIDELKGVQIDTKKNHELYQAYIFMNSLSDSFQDDNITSDQVEALCLEAEQHLGIILKTVAFLLKYKLVTIKNIELIKHRHELPRFRHNHITLNRALTVASTGTAEVGIEFSNFTDNKSVVFIKTKDNSVSDYLNLTPFIIDENALNNDYSSKLYLYAFQAENGYSYQFLNNLRDEPLIVNAGNYASVKQQFDRFKAKIFGQEYALEKKEVSKPGGSRFSRKR